MTGKQDLVLQPKLEAVEVPPNRALLKLFVFMITAVAVGWIWLYVKGWVEPGTFAFFLIVFGVWGAVIVACLRPGASGLLLTPEGFVSRRLFKRNRRYRWDEVLLSASSARTKAPSASASTSPRASRAACAPAIHESRSVRTQRWRPT